LKYYLLKKNVLKDLKMSLEFYDKVTEKSVEKDRRIDFI